MIPPLSVRSICCPAWQVFPDFAFQMAHRLTDWICPTALTGTGQQRGQPIFWEYGIRGSINPGKQEHISPHLAMRSGAWKLLMNPDGSELKLFNLVEDEGETTNLAASHPEKVNAMKAQLSAWWKEMDRYYRVSSQM